MGRMTMATQKIRYTRLQPVRFPSKTGAELVAPKSTKGKSTKEVIAEMKRISKKDVYASE